MSLQRIIAIVLISLANIFILVHAVVPHHHHNDVVCFDVGKHCCHSCPVEESNAGDCHDADMHHSLLDQCNFVQFVERDDQSIQDGFTVFAVDNDLLVATCSLRCYDLLALETVQVVKYERYSLITNHYTCPYVASVFGLRAPPTC